MLTKTLKVFPKFLLFLLVTAILAGAVQFSCTGDPPVAPREDGSTRQDGTSHFTDGQVYLDGESTPDQFVDVMSSGAADMFVDVVTSGAN